MTTDVRATDVTIHHLLSYHLHRVANLISRSAAIRYRRECDVSLAEWRTLALLGADGPMTLNEVARAAGLAKSQMSRVVAGLVRHGLVLRKTASTDARSAQLTLSASGKRTCASLTRASNERNRRLLQCLDSTEQQVIFAVLSKLSAEARRLAQDERRTT